MQVYNEFEQYVLRGFVLGQNGQWCTIDAAIAEENEYFSHLSRGEVLVNGDWVKIEKALRRPIHYPNDGSENDTAENRYSSQTSSKGSLNQNYQPSSEGMEPDYDSNNNYYSDADYQLHETQTQENATSPPAGDFANTNQNQMHPQETEILQIKDHESYKFSQSDASNDYDIEVNAGDDMPSDLHDMRSFVPVEREMKPEIPHGDGETLSEETISEETKTGPQTESILVDELPTDTIALSPSMISNPLQTDSLEVTSESQKLSDEWEMSIELDPSIFQEQEASDKTGLLETNTVDSSIEEQKPNEDVHTATMTSLEEQEASDKTGLLETNTVDSSIEEQKPDEDVHTATKTSLEEQEASDKTGLLETNTVDSSIEEQKPDEDVHIDTKTSLEEQEASDKTGLLETNTIDSSIEEQRIDGETNTDKITTGTEDKKNLTNEMENSNSDDTKTLQIPKEVVEEGNNDEDNQQTELKMKEIDDTVTKKFDLKSGDTDDVKGLSPDEVNPQLEEAEDTAYQQLDNKSTGSEKTTKIAIDQTLTEPSPEDTTTSRLDHGQTEADEIITTDLDSDIADISTHQFIEEDSELIDIESQTIDLSTLKDPNDSAGNLSSKTFDPISLKMSIKNFHLYYIGIAILLIIIIILIRFMI